MWVFQLTLFQQEYYSTIIVAMPLYEILPSNDEPQRHAIF